MPDKFEIIERAAEPGPPHRFEIIRRMEEIRAPVELAKSLEAERREMRIGSAEEQLGAPLRRTPEGALAEFEAPAARFDIARNLDVPGKVAKLKSKFPELTVRTIDDPLGGQLIALSDPSSDKYVLLDSPELVTLSDAAEVGGMVLNLETLFTVGGAIATRGAGFLRRLAGQAVGGITGRTADIAVEKARGFDDQSATEMAGDAALSGLLAATGELLFAPFRRLGRGITRGGFVELTPEEQAAQRTAREMGIEGGLTVGQVTPVIGKMEQQAAQTSKVVQQRHLAQLRASLDDLKRARARFGDFVGLNDAELDTAIRQYEANILKMANVGPVDPAVGGKALQQGRKEYVRAAKAHISRKYDRAIAASEGASLDISEAIDIGRSARKGVRMKLAAQPDPRQPAGFAITRQVVGKAPPKGARVAIDPKGELANLVRQLERLDPNVTMFEDVTAFEQVKTLRTQFFDLKNAALPGQERLDNRIAGEIWSALSEAMDSPVGGSDQFVALHRAAALANRRKEMILDVADLRRIAQTSDLDADALVRRVARPYNGSTLKLLSRIMPRKQFEAVKQSFKADLYSRPETITARLDEFRGDPRALRILLTTDEEAAMRLAGNQYRRFQSAPFKRALSELSGEQQRAVRIVREADDEAIGSWVKRHGGKNSRQGRALRAGVIQMLVDEATEVKRGVEVINLQRGIRLITQLDTSGKLRAVFNADEIAFLKDRRAVLSFLRTTADPGASIRAQELVSQTAEIVTLPVRPEAALSRFFSGVTGLARNAIVGRFFLNPTVREFLVGTGRKQLDFTTMRAVAAVMAELSRDIDLQTRTNKSRARL